MRGFASLDPLWKFIVLVWSTIGLAGVLAVLGLLIKTYFDRKTARKTAYETRKLQDEERIRESRIHPPTPEDLRNYDPMIRKLEDRAKRWFDGLQSIAALLAALKEMLARMRNPRGGGSPPGDDRT
jgi:hypothetical protein